MAHVAMGTYNRTGDYERTAGGFNNRDVQGNNAFYREGNTGQLEYLNFARAPEGTGVPGDGMVQDSGFFPAIAGGIGQVSDRLGSLHLQEHQGGLGRPSSPTDNLRQAIKAVEVAESAIIEQMQENEQLRSELQLTNWELQTYKQEAAPSRQSEENSFQALSQKAGVPSPPQKRGVSDRGVVPSFNGERLPSDGSQADLQGTLAGHQSLPPEYSSRATPPPSGLSTSQNSSANSALNSNPKGLNQGVITGQAAADYSNFSQISTPSSRSVSPNRYLREGDLESRPPLSSQGLIQSPEISNQSNLWKQDLFVRVRAQEEEILQLRKRLADNAIKELKLHNEKHVLEKRIATMRMAFDQQQQDLVDAASKALSYRHDIMEENIRLTYALQAAEQERSIFVSALLPLLAEYDFQPAVMDAHSIVSNVKVLIQHLHEKLNLSEAKLKDSQYHLTAWRADPVYQSPYAPQSPFHPNSDHSNPTSNTHGLEIVLQPGYAQGRMPASPPSRSHNVGGDWDPSAGKYQHVGISGDMYHGAGHEHLRTFESHVHPVSPAPAPNDVRSVFPSDEDSAVHMPVNDPYSDSDFEDAPGIGALKEKDQTQKDGRSPHLPTLPEEPNSSNSEEDDPTPAIENLQIVGDAMPGSVLQACGFSINGTALCVFQWVRYLQDGTMVYIEGAAQPDYTVTADDVDALIAIECVPMDDRNRKGELVKVFANDQNKITCDPTMQDQIESYFFAGQAIFDVQFPVGTLDIWEPAVLTLKRSNYELKGLKQRRVIVSEKYTSELSIVIPYGHQAQFVLTSSAGNIFPLSSNEDSPRNRSPGFVPLNCENLVDSGNGEQHFEGASNPAFCDSNCGTLATKSSLSLGHESGLGIQVDSPVSSVDWPPLSSLWSVDNACKDMVTALGAVKDGLECDKAVGQLLKETEQLEPQCKRSEVPLHLSCCTVHNQTSTLEIVVRLTLFGWSSEPCLLICVPLLVFLVVGLANFSSQMVARIHSNKLSSSGTLPSDGAGSGVGFWVVLPQVSPISMIVVFGSLFSFKIGLLGLLGKCVASNSLMGQR
ncbi:hypothetical protein KI387_002937 [Taxus chinensis]|uniref:Uncharacterized protein n=1 Tax=Taxus chinensis TaxID=29808 RepID=A0AA38LP98_TAXCH|nr:hypothetical protein KI387_002937 [Taxus chinensis]